MGEACSYLEEAPVRRLTVGPFLIGVTAVTNAEFRAFVAATGYVTTAERTLHPVGPPIELAAHFSPPEIGSKRVIKGGSWLCAPSFCLRYRPAARQAQELGLGTNHVGFRVAFDVAADQP